ncbi:DNA mismatch repair protein msh6, partial [Friedmanniomyces endolithicus]
MARGIEGNEIATPRPPPKGKTGSSSGMQSSKGGKQSSIAGFFQKRSAAQDDSVTPAKRPLGHGLLNTFKPAKSTANLTPAPSSGAIASSSPPAAPGPSQDSSMADGRNKENETPGTTYSSPSRKAKKKVSYVESDAEDDEDDVKPASGSRHASKRRRISVKDDSEDESGFDAATQAAMEDDDVMGSHSTSVKSELRPSAHSNAWKADIADFVIADDDEDVQPSKGKKRLGKSASTSRQSTVKPPSPPSLAVEESEEVPTISTAQQWNFDPDAPPSTEPRKPRPQKQIPSGPPKKGKAHQTEPAQRHAWLANILDADRNSPGHPDFDPRTLYIPPMSLADLSDFEQQYWGIKKNYMNTIVFFKKGKFYELYENDATIGHQLFDFKLTDRVNMRM